MKQTELISWNTIPQTIIGWQVKVADMAGNFKTYDNLPVNTYATGLAIEAEWGEFVVVEVRPIQPNGVLGNPLRGTYTANQAPSITVDTPQAFAHNPTGFKS